MDLSKAFHCIPHDLLAAKLHAYGLSDDIVTFVHSYLKRRKQGYTVRVVFIHFYRYTTRFYIRPHFIQYPYK